MERGTVRVRTGTSLNLEAPGDRYLCLLARYIQAWLAHRLHGRPSTISCCRVLAS